MKAITTVNVSCPEQGKVQPYNGILVGKLLTVVMLPSVQANWEYQKEDGTPLMSGTTTIPNEVADVVLGANPIDSMSKADEVFYGVLRQEMATTFGIELEEIEIVE